ncbi:hypothetical protein Y1Q_0009341 [Alligator mississippiensis]|uniref:Uncharacterized protein n=1 Tax=Alligator mississippiensis TaxID=8496 RepID=A0A151N7D3_ALLMI|nr:hypothetical protein Y1Q_0009341 [Alligator mississippiensis]
MRASDKQEERGKGPGKVLSYRLCWLWDNFRLHTKENTTSAQCLVKHLCSAQSAANYLDWAVSLQTSPSVNGNETSPGHTEHLSH